MNEVFSMLSALLAGAVLGVFFFAGLWWTVRKIELTQHVALLFLSSMLLRTSVVILGFYFILGEQWQHLVAGLMGFVIARFVVTRLTRIADQSKKGVAANSA